MERKTGLKSKNFYVRYKGIDDPLSFMNGRVYHVVGYSESARAYAIVDETGEAYAYTLDEFEVVGADERHAA